MIASLLRVGHVMSVILPSKRINQLEEMTHHLLKTSKEIIAKRCKKKSLNQDQDLQDLALNLFQRRISHDHAQLQDQGQGQIRIMTENVLEIILRTMEGTIEMTTELILGLKTEGRITLEEIEVKEEKDSTEEEAITTIKTTSHQQDKMTKKREDLQAAQKAPRERKDPQVARKAPRERKDQLQDQRALKRKATKR